MQLICNKQWPLLNRVAQCSFSPFVTFMSSISMSVDRERMTGTSTVQKVVDDKLDKTATVQNSLTNR